MAATTIKDYTAGHFATDAKTPLARKLWASINQQEWLLAMVVASDLGLPAAAGIEEFLLREFGKDVLSDRVKQLIGHMIRQVMEERGYVVDQHDVKMNSIPFFKATRYRRTDWYRVHVFRAARAPRELCFADSRSGDALPPAPGGGKWRFWSSYCSDLRGAVAYGIDPRKVRETVQKQGYFRWTLTRIASRSN